MNAATLDLAYQRSPRTWLRLGEPPADPLSEADLSTIWAGQRYPAGALSTADGRSLRVLNPGRLNNGPGPDFRDAVLELDGRRHRGDVELHVRASAFRGHGHHQDPAYDGLALHVVYMADDGPDTLLAGGGRAPVAAFAPWLSGRIEELQGWLVAPPLWQEPCQTATARLDADAIAATLDAAGLERWRAKASRLADASASTGLAQALWSALLDALGAGGDREGFRRLAAVFPESLARSLVDSLEPEQALGGVQTALLAAAGLTAAPPWLAGVLPAPLRPPIQRSGRPLNWPERRLAALAHLYLRAAADLPAFAAASIREAASIGDLLPLWQVASATGSGPALLGRQRAQELLLNVVLPFAASLPELRPRAEAFLVQLPAGAAYSRTAFLEANLRRADGKRRVRGALEQQGLLALLEDWCSQGGCGRCPLS